MAIEQLLTDENLTVEALLNSVPIEPESARAERSEQQLDHLNNLDLRKPLVWNAYAGDKALNDYGISFKRSLTRPVEGSDKLKDRLVTATMTRLQRLRNQGHQS